MTPFERVFHAMKRPWFMVFYAILVILTYSFIDKPLATYFYHLDLRTHMQFLSILTVLGQWQVYIVLFLFAGLYFRYVRINSVYEVRIGYLFLCVLTTNLICLFLKVALSRARPDLLFLSQEYGFYWFKLNSNYWSFPSGHTVTVISLAAGLGILFPRYFYGLLGIALLVVVTRILLCRHYLSDVMSGFYISVLLIGFFTDHIKGLVGYGDRIKKLG